jgi:hypothetical protein
MTEKSDSDLPNADVEYVIDLFEDGKPDIIDTQRLALMAACKEAKANREKAANVIATQSGKPLNLENLT